MRAGDWAGRAAVATVLLGLAACAPGGGFQVGTPGPDVPKQAGPLTVPPPGVLAGTAR